MNPCQSPIQNPAGTSSNAMFPGAHEVRTSKAMMKTGSHLEIFEKFIIWKLGICEYKDLFRDQNRKYFFHLRRSFIFGNSKHIEI